MIIERGYIWCKVSGTEKELAWLHSSFTITTSHYNKGWHSKEYHLFHKRNRVFAAGLLSKCLEIGKKAGVRIQVIDKRSLPSTSPAPKECSHLFYYQNAAVDAVIENGNGIIKIPTAGGKTEIAVTIAARVNGNTLFLADEKTLREQAGERWQTIMRMPAGTISEPKKFTVATLQTLHSRMKRSISLKQYLRTIDCLIVDECHIAAASSYYRVITSIPAYFRVGLSATPFGRSDRKDAYVVGAFGPVLYTVSIQELVDFGRLSQSDVVFYNFPGVKPEDMRIRKRQWETVYRKGIVGCEPRNRAVVRVCKIIPKPAMVFVERVSHGYRLKSMLEEAGFSTEFVWRKHSVQDRRKYLTQINSHQLDVLVCSRIFNKGVNAPGVRSGVNAAGYKGKIPTLQRAGRPMRVTDTKSSFVFVDFADTHDTTLYKHAKMRWRRYKQEGMRVRLANSLEELASGIDVLKTTASGFATTKPEAVYRGRLRNA